MIRWSSLTHSEHWQNFRSVFMSATVGQIETKWAQIGPVEFGGRGVEWVGGYSIRKKATYSLHNDNFVSSGLQRASTKIGVIVTCYSIHRRTDETRQILCTFCRQSVIRGLRCLELPSLSRIKTNTCSLWLTSPAFITDWG
jgi:hypothetical protein